jgi:hypothetical protein
VEAQQAEAGEKQARTRPPLTADEAARWREKENLRLARQSVLQQMAASPNPRHRKLLDDALADLDEKLKKLTSDLGPQTRSDVRGPTSEVRGLKSEVRRV